MARRRNCCRLGRDSCSVHYGVSRDRAGGAVQSLLSHRFDHLRRGTGKNNAVDIVLYTFRRAEKRDLGRGGVEGEGKGGERGAWRVRGGGEEGLQWLERMGEDICWLVEGGGWLAWRGEGGVLWLKEGVGRGAPLAWECGRGGPLVLGGKGKGKRGFSAVVACMHAFFCLSLRRPGNVRDQTERANDGGVDVLSSLRPVSYAPRVGEGKTATRTSRTIGSARWKCRLQY